LYYLYILKSKPSGIFYVGSSENPVRRLEFHNSVEKGFTSRYRPWELIYTKAYTNKNEAQVVERKIKSWKSRVMIEKLLKGELEI